MENLIKSLKVSSIITKEEIEKIRLYINKKYPNNSSKENSKILSKTIYGIIDRNLEGIDEKYIDSIRKELMQNTILKNKDMFKMDVFNACIFNECVENANTEKLENNTKFKDSVIAWLNKSEKTNICKDDFDKYVSTVIKKDKTCFVNDVASVIKENEILSKEQIEKCNNSLDYSENNSIADSEVASDIAISVNVDCNVVASQNGKHNIAVNKKAIFALIFLLIFSIASITYVLVGKDKTSIGIKNNDNKNKNKISVNNSVKIKQTVNKSEIAYHPHLPESFNYKDINELKLKEFLKTKNSLLIEEPYFSDIIKASKEFNLNPLILFAITGQEQAFVPKHNKNAKKIVNNPYNVFHSWKEYNTDIYDASRIASRTVINLSKNKPKGVDTFIWINRKYAEDKEWGKGVGAIYKLLELNTQKSK